MRIWRPRGIPLEELPLGGTAIGTGLNAHPEMPGRAIRGIAEETGIPFRSMENLFQGISFRSAQVDLMGVINSVSTDLMKIANDLRLLTSGPRSGLGEIMLPSLQPGSSIMPGKVNPVIPEMVIQAAAYLQGKALSVSIANQHGPLQLNMMMPPDIPRNPERLVSSGRNGGDLRPELCGRYYG